MTFKTPEDERGACRYCAVVLAGIVLVIGVSVLVAVLMRGWNRGY